MSHEHTRPRPGESAPFHFESVWRVADPLAAVWSVLTDVEAWPQWWPGIAVATTDDSGVHPGSRAGITVRSPLGVAFDITLSIEGLTPARQVRLVADGDLRGVGVWTLARTGPLTAISSTWCVTTRRRSVRVLRPVSAGMHGFVMRAGEDGLRRRLSALA
ncbi:SRPBCC family protein [Brevibacterium sp. 2SA]|uniref:SRPBCC family protein n=1 Tax=Brevibacterium sp. 2SA TaxID=2502198 RepID=UPI0010F83953|nr:SRPBCC family protein [Brevibacterium sp. 2SA]